ncbi:MAG: hypothetical protein NTU44_05045 [Bacteroidetes bacterium]|nr:hypothetical protein [Bacteroidota bacterium]
MADKALYKYDGSTVTHITTTMGLPSDNVNCLKRTANGIYIGTTDAGLAFYDGSAFTVYNTSNSGLSSDNIFDLDWRNDTLFMSLINSDIAFLHNGVITLLTNANLHYGRIALDSQGKIWLASYGNGVYKLSLNGTITQYQYATNPIFDQFDQYNCISVDVNNHVWVGTQQAGLLEYDPSGTTHIDNTKPSDYQAHVWIDPSGSSSKFNLELPFSAPVILDLFDVSGRWISSPYQGMMPGGFSSVHFPAGLQAGVYIYRFTSGRFTVTGKCLVK